MDRTTGGAEANRTTGNLPGRKAGFPAAAARAARNYGWNGGGFSRTRSVRNHLAQRE